MSKRSKLPQFRLAANRNKLPKRSTRTKRSSSSTRVPAHLIEAFERRLDRWTIKLLARSLRLHALALRSK